MYAGFWKRFAAYIIDSIILSIASYVLLFIIGLLAALISGSAKSGGAQAALVVTGLLSILFFIFAPIFYFAFFEASSLQATPGKLALDIKVTDMHGRRITFMRSFGRNLAKFISAITFNIGYVMAGFTVRKQALHDKIADALVIDKNADTNNLQPLSPASIGMVILAIAGAIVPVVLAIAFFAGIILAISLPQYKKAAEKSRATEALVTLGSIISAQERHRLTKGVYAGNFESLDTGFANADASMAKGSRIMTRNFQIDLGPNFAYASRIGGNPARPYTITKCYSSNKLCCVGADCAGLGITNAASPSDCCI